MRKINEFVGTWCGRLYKMEWLKDSRSQDYARIISTGQILKLEKVN
jgi:hypothetical protein